MFGFERSNFARPEPKNMIKDRRSSFIVGFREKLTPVHADDLFSAKKKKTFHNLELGNNHQKLV